MRNRALIALARWGPPSVAEWCSKRLKGGDSFKTLAVWAIGRIALVSPVGEKTIGRVISATKAIDKYGEFLLSAVPALGQIGRYETKKQKERIENFLLNLLRVLPAIKNPPSQGGTGAGFVANNDPPGIRGKIIKERIQIALALMNRKGELKWLKENSGKVHITNTVLAAESLELIQKEENGR